MKNEERNMKRIETLHTQIHVVIVQNHLISVLILIDPQNAFFHVCISEGEGERMEQFVDFCEDAIFEMQISTALSGDDGEVAKVCRKISSCHYVSMGNFR